MKKNLLILITILCIGILPKITLAETYDGEYSIDYLLKNYNVVTLGINDNYANNISPNNYNYNYSSIVNKGSITYNNDLIYNNTNNKTSSVEGAVLVNGDYTTRYDSIFGTQAGNIKSFIKGTKGGNVTTPSQLVTDSNYIDFNKMYNQVITESQWLVNNTEYYINSAKAEISKPGIYTVNNIARQYTNGTICHYGGASGDCVTNNSILIRNYDKNDVYVFNYYNEYIAVNSLPNIDIIENGSSNSVSLKEYIENNNYTGNIIFNFPNALSINLGFAFNWHYLGFFNCEQNNGFIGHIIAPKATVVLYDNFCENDSYYYGTIIADNINDSGIYYRYNSNIKETKYTSNKKIINNTVHYSKIATDYLDDYYTRDYSIKDLLKNYSLVTLGHKSIDSKSKLLEYGNTPGSVRLFHITGQALIAGDLYGKIYENEEDSYYTHTPKFDRTAFDLESNEATESYVRGKARITVRRDTDNCNSTHSYMSSVIQPWDNMTNDNKRYVYQKNTLFIGSSDSTITITTTNDCYYDSKSSAGPGTVTQFISDYINFDRLYSNIVSEQKEIEEGYKITPSNGKAHIKIGGSYTIDNINDINEIIFDNFENNKDVVTIIKVKNTGDINFPLISKDTGNYKGIVTNDYFGKNGATHLYEENTFITKDSYYGNIIWNIPDATYIKLKEGAPFAGHMIAPNADVETEETHFAGCFIVNSIYGEGNTEAHFYPLTRTATYEVPDYDDLTPTQKKALDAKRLDHMLGGRGSEIETTILGDEEQYRQDDNYFDNLINQEEQNKGNNGGIISPIIESLKTNPKTLSTIGIIISLITMIGLSLYVTFKRKKNI